MAKKDGNFKVIATREFKSPDITKGKVYEFKNGSTVWDDGKVSMSYEDSNELIAKNPSLGLEPIAEPLELFASVKTISIRTIKNKVVATITDGERQYTQHVKLSSVNGNYKAAVKMAVDRVLNRFEFEEVAVKEVKRQAKVGEFIKVTDAHSFNDEYSNGCTFIVKELPSNGTCGVKVLFPGDTTTSCICNSEYVVLENYVPEKINGIGEVKRPAKAGEWVKVIKMKVPHNGYKTGDIFKVEEMYCDDGVIDKPYWVSSEEYVVLENYHPDTPSPVKFRKAKVGDRIKIVKKERHDPTVEIGDIFTVTNVYGSWISTEKNAFDDSDEEYIILSK